MRFPWELGDSSPDVGICLRMFLFHSLAVAEVNQAEPEPGVVNGLYVTHITAVVCWNWFRVIYDAYGWVATLGCLMVVVSWGCWRY